MSELLQIVLTSSVVAAGISALVTVWTVQRKISIENITKERKEWREKVRRKSLEVHNAIMSRNDNEIQKLKFEFTLILNPINAEDNYDKYIIKWIRLTEEGKEIEGSDEFSKQVSFLLKHDWDRAKLEAGSLFCRLKCINRLCKCIFVSPIREK